MRIKEIVQHLIKKYKTNNPFEIAEMRNVIIRELPLGQTFGFYMYNCRFQVITLNETLDEHIQKFVCAHELGHSILHPHSNTPFLKENTLFSTNKIEREANKFAVELLLPDSIFYENHCTTIYEAAAIYGVPKELVHLKTFSQT